MVIEPKKSRTVIHDEEDRQRNNDTAELLRMHQNFGHMSFTKLQVMAKQGVTPKRLANCAIPKCSSCQYAKATKRPWRSKARKNRKL